MGKMRKEEKKNEQQRAADKSSQSPFKKCALVQQILSCYPPVSSFQKAYLIGERLKLAF